MSLAMHSTNGSHASPDAWRVTKRDGKIVDFDATRIQRVINLSFQSVGRPELGPHLTAGITQRVINCLAASPPMGWGNKVFDIEDIQRAVIQQLWAEGQVEAAEHFTIYREERRRAREEAAVDPEHAAAVAADQAHFPTPLQYYQFVSKFARWRPDKGRRETWRECVDRVFAWFATTPGWAALEQSERDWLWQMMYEFKASPAMRVVQMAGPPLERCHVGCYNCAYLPILDLFSFAELLYILMQGSGVGFSVESEYVNRLPRVKKQQRKEPNKYVIPDNTEGWCDALLFGLRAWFGGEDAEFDYTLIRPKGTPLVTKGGQASGPEPLRTLLQFCRALILKRQGKHLNDIDVHDICCMIGKIVQVGGVRRASCISLSDLDSVAMRQAKHGDWWTHSNQRSMSNNSAVYEEKPAAEVFLAEWLALVQSRSGERGIFNREGAQRTRPARRKKAVWGANPCNEIRLRPWQFCNLTIAVVRPGDTYEEIEEKVRAATYFGTLQAACTNFRYIRKEWARNCEEEALLGVDIMGHLDHPLLRPPLDKPIHTSVPFSKARADRRSHLMNLRDFVRRQNEDLAERMGIAASAANTCLKPGGDSGVFFGSSNLSPTFAQYQIRRVRENKESPVAKLLVAQGVPHEEAAEDSQLWAFSFLRENPEGCITREKMTAIQQLENWLDWQECWAEHGCSVTIYVKEEEWLEVGAWVYQHFDRLTGVSFLPWDNGTYRTVPNEALTKEQFDKLHAEFPQLDWSRLMRYEKRDETVSGRTYACTGDICELV